MAYADRNQGGSRVVAIVIVSVLVFAMGFAFVNGLAYNYVKKVADKLKAFDVQEPPPPPPDVPPPPPPPDQPLPPPPVVAPPPIVANPNPPPVMIQTRPTPPPVFVPTPQAAPAPPPPTINRQAGAKGDPAQWITNDDYPSRALQDKAAGTTSIRWDINTQGRVENCVVTASSGNSDLDQAACRAITRRGKYSPALDQSGNPIRSSSARRVVWRIPDE